MREWAARAEALVDREPPAAPERSFHLSSTLDGRGEARGSFDAEGTEILRTALRLAETTDGEGDAVRSAAQRRGDAVVALGQFFLDHQIDRAGGRRRPQVNVVIDVDDLEQRGPGRFVDGAVLDPTTMQRLLCDAELHRVLTARPSTILDYGHTTRTIPVPLWSALVLRDGHCRFPGCDRPPRWSEGHHVTHWSAGGTTELAKLVLLCSRHHHVCHLPGWEVKLRPDGELRVTKPDGRVLSSSVPGRLPKPKRPDPDP